MSFRLMKTALLLGCCCSIMMSAQARSRSGNSYYVDSLNGSDARNGRSPTTAWKSVKAVNAHLFRSGDHIYFRAGCEFPGMMRPLGSGTPAAPIVIDRYREGTMPLFTGDGGRATILLSDVSFWILRHVQVSNDAPAEGKRSGILLEATRSAEIVRNITIQDVHVFNVRGLTGEDNTAKDTGGIGIIAQRLDRPARFVDVLISRCNIEHVDNVGIWLNSYPLLNPLSPAWSLAKNEHIRVMNNQISDTGRNAIILRQAQAPVIEGNTVTHSSARHHGNAIFTRSTRDALISKNEVSFTGTEPSGENAAFDADIDSLHTVIEYNWSHDNQGGLFSLCNNPSNDANVTDGTVVRFNVSENDGVRAFGFSGRVTHSTIYNNTVLIGEGRKEAIVEARPFLRDKPRFADGATFFNNVVIILGEGSYDFAGATDMTFDSNCIVGESINPFLETRRFVVAASSFRAFAPSASWSSLSKYRAVAIACQPALHPEPSHVSRDISGTRIWKVSFRGALQP